MLRSVFVGSALLVVAVAVVEPLVTVVMPAWRPRKDWLLAAVRSALGQRGCRVEVVVVDDGSPQPVAELLDDVEDDRLRVVRAAHGGPAAARNTGVEEARGDRIRFVDADDFYEPDSTARLLQLAHGDEVIAYGATLLCDEELRPERPLTCDVQGAAVEACLLDSLPVMVQSLLFPRSVIDKVGGWALDPTLLPSEDWDFVLRCLEHAEVRGDQHVATRYRQHLGSLSWQTEKGREAAQRVVECYFERHPDQRGTRLERRARAMLHARSARSYAGHGRRLRALGHSARALALEPRRAPSELPHAARVAAGGLLREGSQRARGQGGG